MLKQINTISQVSFVKMQNKRCKFCLTTAIIVRHLIIVSNNFFSLTINAKIKVRTQQQKQQ